MGSELSYEVDNIQKDVLPPRNNPSLFAVASLTIDASTDMPLLGKTYKDCDDYMPQRIKDMLKFYKTDIPKGKLKDAWCEKYWDLRDVEPLDEELEKNAVGKIYWYKAMN